MKRFLSILLSLATLVSVAACSAPASSSVAPASAAASASTEAPAATELDVLKIGVAALPDTMDPIIVDDCQVIGRVFGMMRIFH